MSFRLVEPPKTVEITPAAARKHYETQGVPNDRPERPRILDALRREAADGRWRPCVWAVAYCKETKATYRVNGKHSSKVLMDLNGTMPDKAQAVMERYECETMEDVAQLYSTFDYRQGARSVSDINRAYAASVPALKKVGHGTIDRAVSGMAYAAWESKTKDIGANQRAQLMIEHVAFVRWLDTFLAEGGPARHMKRGAVIAAIFLAYHMDKSACTKFWSEVRDGENKSPDAPSKKLYRLLVEGKTTSSAQHMTTREIFVKCIHGWNAWRQGKATDLKFYPKAATPKVL